MKFSLKMKFQSYMKYPNCFSNGFDKNFRIVRFTLLAFNCFRFHKYTFEKERLHEQWIFRKAYLYILFHHRYFEIYQLIFVKKLYTYGEHAFFQLFGYLKPDSLFSFVIGIINYIHWAMKIGKKLLVSAYF